MQPADGSLVVPRSRFRERIDCPWLSRPPGEFALLRCTQSVQIADRARVRAHTPPIAYCQRPRISSLPLSRSPAVLSQVRVRPLLCFTARLTAGRVRLKVGSSRRQRPVTACSGAHRDGLTCCTVAGRDGCRRRALTARTAAGGQRFLRHRRRERELDEPNTIEEIAADHPCLFVLFSLVSPSSPPRRWRPLLSRGRLFVHQRRPAQGGAAPHQATGRHKFNQPTDRPPHAPAHRTISSEAKRARRPRAHHRPRARSAAQATTRRTDEGEREGEETSEARERERFRLLGANGGGSCTTHSSPAHPASPSRRRRESSFHPCRHWAARGTRVDRSEVRGATIFVRLALARSLVSLARERGRCEGASSGIRIFSHTPPSRASSRTRTRPPLDPIHSDRAHTESFRITRE